MNSGTCNKSQCVCPSGFEGSRCERFEPCSSNNCKEPMACLGGKCICPDNINCGPACAVYPCVNGGTCHNKGSGYYCQCPSGYNGELSSLVLIVNAIIPMG